MLRVENGALYTGIAKNLFSRMADHTGQGKKCARYTRAHKAVALESVWSCADRGTASRMEYAVKQLTKKEKERLISSPRLFSALLPTLEKEDFVHHPLACLPLFKKEITLKHLL
jgi:putative endonuclease